TAGRSWGVLFRHPDCYAQPSPAALRLHLRNCNGATRVAIKQSEGGLADAELVMELSRRTAVVPQPATPHAPAPLQRRRQQPSGERSRSVPAPRQPESAQLDLPFA